MIKTDEIYSWRALLLICALSLFISHFTTNFSPLIIAVLLGAFYANAFKKSAKRIKSGNAIVISTRQILRLGIILFGFRISLTQMTEVGASGIVFAFFIVFSAFALGYILGRALGLDKKSYILIGSGSSICGAAAVLAAQSIVKADSRRVAVAICTVVVFGTIGMFIYPFIFKFLALTPVQMGFFTGSSLHEVAHVVAVGAAIGEETQRVAVIVKMMRVIMLVPFLLMLAMLNLKISNRLNLKEIRASVPWFAIWFLIAICINSLPFFPHALLPAINFIDTALLTLAMGALGLTIDKNALKNAGLKPFILAIAIFFWLFLSSLIFVKNFI